MTLVKHVFTQNKQLWKIWWATLKYFLKKVEKNEVGAVLSPPPSHHDVRGLRRSWRGRYPVAVVLYQNFSVLRNNVIVA